MAVRLTEEERKNLLRERQATARSDAQKRIAGRKAAASGTAAGTASDRQKLIQERQTAARAEAEERIAARKAERSESAARQTEYSNWNYAAERAAKYGASRDDFDSRNRARNTVRRVTATPEAQEYERLKNEQKQMRERAESHVVSDEEANRARDIAERINAYETSRDYERRQAAENLLEDAKAKQATGKRAAEYAALMREPDFAAASQYRSTQHGEPKYNALAGMYTDTGFGDVKYDYINGNEAARDVAGANEQLLGISEAGIGSDRLQRMTPDEIAIYNYLYNKQGEAAADEFIEFIATDPNYTGGSLNAREREYEEQRMAEYAKEDPVGTSIASVMLSPYRGIAPAAGAIGDFLEDGRLERDAGYYSSINRTTAARSAVNEYITENYGSGWAYAYDQLMSIGDNAMRGVLFGEGSGLALMAADAGASKVQSALDRGLGDGQALALGIIAGAAEVFTEKFSLDQLFKKAEPGKSAFLRWLAQVGVEGSEEGASNIINTFFDVLIAGDESEWRTAVRKYEEQGMSEGKAFGQAMADKLGDIGMDVLGGMISGGIMGAPGSIYQGTINRRARAAERAAEVQQEAGNAAEVRQSENAEAVPELVPVSEKAASRLATGKNNIIARTKDDIVAFVRNALRKKGGSERLYMGTIPDSAAQTVMESTGVNVAGYNAILQGSVVQHIFNHHGNERTEAARGQRAVTPDDFPLISQVLAAPDSVALSPDTDAYGRQVLIFEKQIGDNIVTAQAVTDGRHALATDSMWVQKKKEPTDTTPNAGIASAPGENVRNVPSSGSFNDSISQPGQNVNTEQARPTAQTLSDEITRQWDRARESGGTSQERSESSPERSATSAEPMPLTVGEEFNRRNRAALARSEVEKTGILAGARDEDISAAERISRAVGREVRFYDSRSAESSTAAGANGYYKGGVIYVNAESGNPVAQIISHELTHSLEGSKLYSQLSDMVLSRMRESGESVEDARKQKAALYERSGAALADNAAVDRELVAEYIEKHLLTDEDAVIRMVRENRGLAVRIKNRLDSLLAKLGSDAARERAFVRRAVNLYARALDDAENVKGRARRRTVDARARADAAVSARAEETAAETRRERLRQAGERLAAGEMSEEEYDREFDENYSAEDALRNGPEYSFSEVSEPTYEDLIAKPDIAIVDIRGTSTERIAEQRRAFLASDAAREMYSAPVVNRDTGESIFITPQSITHTFSNLGRDQIGVAKHLRELLEEAVFTHAEQSRNAPGDHTTGVYTLFAAARTEQGSKPVKLKVKEYNLAGQDIPRTVREYLEDKMQSETYASLYDGNVLVLEEIEKEDSSSSAPTDATNVAVKHPSESSSTISVKDLLALVKGDAAKYIPKPSVPEYSISEDSEGRELSEDEDWNSLEANEPSAEQDAWPEWIHLPSPDTDVQSREIAENADAGTEEQTLPAQSHLPYSARKELKSAETYLLRAVGNSLGVPRGVQAEIIGEAVGELAQNYYKSGTLTDEARNTAFDKAYEATRQSESEVAEKYGKIKDYVSGVTIAVDPKERAEMEHWASFERSASGLMTFGENGIPFREVYKEAQRIDPQMLPDIISDGNGHSEELNTADKLSRLLYTVRAAEGAARKAAGNGLSEEIDRQFMRHHFDDAVDSSLSKLSAARQNAINLAREDAEIRAERDEEERQRIPAQMVENEMWADFFRKRNGDNTAPDAAESGETADAAGTERAKLPTKARSYLRSAESYMRAAIGNALSIPKAAQRTVVGNLVETLADEYLGNGSISEESLSDAFEQAYNAGRIIDSAFYEMYKPVKTYLRDTKISVGPELRESMPNWEQFRKSVFGRLTLVKAENAADGTARSAGDFYEELSSAAPELFPESITGEINRIERMAFVSQAIARTERTLDENGGTNAEAYKSILRHNFNEAVYDTVPKLRDIKRYAQASEAKRAAEEAAREARKQLRSMTAEEAAALYAEMKETRRALEKAKARNLLIDEDKTKVGRLLKGDIQIEDLDPAKDNVKGIQAVYEAARKHEEIVGKLREYNEGRAATLRDEAKEMLKGAEKWHDKKMGVLYSRETAERNVRDVVGDDEKAQEIIDTYFTPVHKNEAESTKMKNRLRDKVRELNLSRRVKKGNSMSAAALVQFVGEAEDNIAVLSTGANARDPQAKRGGMTLEEWRGALENAWKENPNIDRAKIENAVETFRELYDYLFKKINEVRVRNGYEPISYRRGYFPHFQSEQRSGVLGWLGKAFGVQTEVTNLPTTINGRTEDFKPGIRWMGAALERKGNATTFDAVEGFDRYLEVAADVIWHTDDIQRLRALATATRERTTDESIQADIERIRADDKLTEEEKQDQIRTKVDKGPYELSNFAGWIDEYTNLLAGKKSRADRQMEADAGRGMYNVLKALESRVGANMVGFNVRSATTNFIPITQGWADLGGGTVLRGMWDTLKAHSPRAKFMQAVRNGGWSVGGIIEALSDNMPLDDFSDMSEFLTNRRGSERLVQTRTQEIVGKTPLRMARDLMETVDRFSSETLVRARYAQNVKRGLSEQSAMDEADAWAAGVMAARSKGSMPTLFSRANPVTKLFTQFQLEVNNQFSYLMKDVPREHREKGMASLAWALLKFAIGAWLFNEASELLTGYRPALDPIGILNDTVGDLTGYELPNVFRLAKGAITGDMPSFETEQEGVYGAGKNLAKNVAEELPFVGGLLGGGRIPVSSAKPSFTNLWSAATNPDWAPEKRRKTAADELSKPFTYLLPPAGGGAVRRVIEGAATSAAGGSYTVNSKGEDILQYPEYTDEGAGSFWDVVKSMIMGKSSLDTAQDWVRSGFDSLSAKQTTAYREMTDAGMGQRDAFELLREIEGDEMTKAEKMRAVVNATDIEEARLAAMKTVLTEAAYDKVAAAGEFGVSSESWTELMEALPDYDDGNGSYTQAEVADALGSMKQLTREEKAVLWQAQAKNWSPKKNPYDTRLGEEVADRLNREEEDVPEWVSLPTP